MTTEKDKLDMEAKVGDLERICDPVTVKALGNRVDYLDFWAAYDRLSSGGAPPLEALRLASLEVPDYGEPDWRVEERLVGLAALGRIPVSQLPEHLQKEVSGELRREHFNSALRRGLAYAWAILTFKEPRR